MKNNLSLIPVHVTDANYLRHQQYKTDANLAARQRIHQDFSLNPESVFVWLAALADLQLGHKVLDVGCGNGHLWRDTLNAGANADYELALVDLSSGMISQARKGIDGRIRRWSATQASATTLPFSRSYFDRVFANYMLYHVPDVDQAVADFRRILAPQGKLIVTLLGQKHMYELWLLLASLLDTEDDLRTGRFLAEHASPYLETHFAQVTPHHYDDALQITDAALLWEYVYSLIRFNVAEDINLSDLRAKFERAVQDDIDRYGHFYIQKDTVVFLCQ